MHPQLKQNKKRSIDYKIVKKRFCEINWNNFYCFWSKGVIFENSPPRDEIYPQLQKNEKRSNDDKMILFSRGDCRGKSVLTEGSKENFTSCILKIKFGFILVER